MVHQSLDRNSAESRIDETVKAVCPVEVNHISVTHIRNRRLKIDVARRRQTFGACRGEEIDDQALIASPLRHRQPDVERGLQRSFDAGQGELVKISTETGGGTLDKTIRLP